MGRRSLLLIVFQSRLKGEEMKGEGLPQLGLSWWSSEMVPRIMIEVTIC